MDVTFAE